MSHSCMQAAAKQPKVISYPWSLFPPRRARPGPCPHTRWSTTLKLLPEAGPSLPIYPEAGMSHTFMYLYFLKAVAPHAGGEFFFFFFTLVTGPRRSLS